MAENANASQEATMPAFVRAGMDFFSGKTVLKSTLDAKAQELESANARIKELEAAAIDPKPLNDRIAALEKEATEKDTQIAAHLETIKTLEANYQTASRQAQQQVAKAGAQAPVNVEKPANQSGDKDFAALVQEQVAAGKTKAQAIAACIQLHPDKYAEAKKNGFGNL